MDEPPYILIVDDDDTTREFLTQLLTEEGCALAFVDNAERAREAIKQQVFDAVLIEAALPGGSGIALADQLLSLGLPVILMTGEPAAMAQLDAEARGYLTKPLRPAVVLEALHIALQVAALHKDLPGQEAPH